MGARRIRRRALGADSTGCIRSNRADRRRLEFDSFGARGGSLVELLFSMTLASVLGVLGVSLVHCVVAAHRRHERTTAAWQAAVTALDLLGRDIATVGAAPVGAGGGIILATVDRLVLRSDANADGDGDDANERVAYLIHHERHQLSRASGAGSPQPLLRGLAPAGAGFSYLGQQGDLVVPGSDADALRQVVAVRVAIAVAAGGEAIPFERTWALRRP